MAYNPAYSSCPWKEHPTWVVEADACRSSPDNPPVNELGAGSLPTTRGARRSFVTVTAAAPFGAILGRLLQRPVLHPVGGADTEPANIRISNKLANVKEVGAYREAKLICL
jgi:hypothetical protein